jgi:spore coat polysaccharide biosynthesis protein SpsF
MILGILQARLSSTRLPGKVLEPILGQPMLARQIERLRRAKRMDHLIVATSTAAEDDAIATLCESLGVDCSRGSLDDVLDRFYQAALPFGCEWIVRLTGDCPLADWDIIDAAIAFAVNGDYDYASNALAPSWPDGLDVEVVRFAALAEAWKDAKLPSEREHVTPFIEQHPERFKLGSFVNDRDLSGGRWTVDEPADLAFVRKVYEYLYPVNPAFGWMDVLALLRDHPDIAAINSGILRNEGYLTSLAADANSQKRV